MDSGCHEPTGMLALYTCTSSWNFFYLCGCLCLCLCLCHFLARFNEKMNIQNISARATQKGLRGVHSNGDNILCDHSFSKEVFAVFLLDFGICVKM